MLYRSFTGLGIGGGWASGQALIAESMPRRAARALCRICPDRRATRRVPRRGGIRLPRAAPRMALGLRDFFAARRSSSRSPNGAFCPRATYGSAPANAHSSAPRNGRSCARIATSFLLLGLWLLLNSEAYWFTYSWMPGYLQMQRGLSTADSGRLMIHMQYGGVFGYAIFGMLADRFGRRPMFTMFALALAVGLVPATLMWPQASRIPGLIVTAMMLTGFGTGLWAGAAPYMSELLPTRVRNAAMGALLNMTRGFQFFTPLVITELGQSCRPRRGAIRWARCFRSRPPRWYGRCRRRAADRSSNSTVPSALVSRLGLKRRLDSVAKCSTISASYAILSPDLAGDLFLHFQRLSSAARSRRSIFENAAFPRMIWLRLCSRHCVNSRERPRRSGFAFAFLSDHVAEPGRLCLIR